MKPYRPRIPAKLRELIFDECNGLCAYCNYEIATEIDHIIPYDYVRTHDPDNLVASCARCNRLASDLMFDDFDAKREFILKRREEKKVQNDFLREYSFCTDCQESYNPRKKGATMFLCPRCAKNPVKWLD